MKSPLVDALRLASGQDKTANSDSVPVDADDAKQNEDLVEAEPGPTPPGNEVADTGELSLLDATGVLDVESPSEEPDAIDPGQTIAEAPDFEQPEAALPAAQDTHIVAAVPQINKRPGILRLARFSPLICLLLASAATGSYFLYQALGGNLQGTGLGMLSTQVGLANSTGTVIEAVGPINHFPLVTEGVDARASEALLPAVPDNRDAAAESTIDAEPVVAQNVPPADRSANRRIVQ